MQIIKNILRTAAVAAGTLPFAALATHVAGTVHTAVTTIEGVKTLLERVVGWVQVFFFIIAALFIILAAFKYLTAGGDEEKVKGAKNMLIYAIVAIVIAALAFGVTQIVTGFVG